MGATLAEPGFFRLLRAVAGWQVRSSFMVHPLTQWFRQQTLEFLCALGVLRKTCARQGHKTTQIVASFALSWEMTHLALFPFFFSLVPTSPGMLVLTHLSLCSHDCRQSWKSAHYFDEPPVFSARSAFGFFARVDFLVPSSAHTCECLWECVSHIRFVPPLISVFLLCHRCT